MLILYINQNYAFNYYWKKILYILGVSIDWVIQIAENSLKKKQPNGFQTIT